MALIEVKNVSKVFTKPVRESGILGMLKTMFSTKKISTVAVDNISFTINEGEMVAYIGANGAGKTTFLKILAGDIEPNTGSVSITEKERMSVLRQDHFKYDEETVLDVVIMGHERLYQIMQEKDALYMKPDFSEEDGIKAAELEGEFAELDGWDAETNAEKILMGLGIEKDLHYKQLKELEGGEKVKVLLLNDVFLTNSQKLEEPVTP